MTTLADRKDTVKWVTFSARETTIKWPKCRAILVTKGPWVGFEFHRCLYVQGCSAIGGTFAEPLPVGLLPWHWCNPKRSSNNLPDVTFLFHFQLISQVMVLPNCTAGRCCLYRAMLRNELTISWVKCTVVQGWVSNTIAIASRLPSMVPHRGARGRAISVYLTPWPPTCSGALPTGCTIEVAALLAFTADAAIQDAPGRLSHTCTCQRRGKHRDHSKWSKGSYSTHSPALFATCIFVKRSEGGQLPRYGQQYPVVKGLRPGADLLNLCYRRLWSGSKGNMRLDMAVFAWGLWCTNKMHATKMVTSCNASEGG